AVYKDAEGDVAVLKRTDLSDAEAAEFGAVVGALIGLGAAGLEGAESGAERVVEAGADGIDMLSQEEAWDVVADIPTSTSAAIILLEHRWAIPLRDSIARAGGFRVADGFIPPLDLVAIVLIAAEEAEALASAET